MKKISDTNTQKVVDPAAAPSANESATAALSRLFPDNPDATVITVLCPRADYSASRLAHAVEDCNANVLNLNVTGELATDDMLLVELRIDRKNTASIGRSLARYRYQVIGNDEPDLLSTDTDRRRVAELLRYIDI